MPILFLLFVLLPIIEIMVLINVSGSIGGLNTFFIVIITAFFGAYFVRQQGFSLITQVQSKTARGEAPGAELAEGMLLLVAGVLLITPGFITDAMGFLFTLPFSRKPIASFLIAQVLKRQPNGFHFTAHSDFGRNDQKQQNSPFEQNQSNDGDIIDCEYTDKSESSNDKNKLN